MVYYLIEKLGDVESDDLETIGYALFPTLDADAQSGKAEKLIAQLLTAGRVDHKDGAFVALAEPLQTLQIVTPPEADNNPSPKIVEIPKPDQQEKMG